MREYAAGLLAIGCRPESVLALEHATDSEALMLAIAALEVGVTIRLGPACAPFAAGFARLPVRAAELAASGGLDPVCVPTAVASDNAASLERLAAHGVMHVALEPDAVRERSRLRRGNQCALITRNGIELSLTQLHAGVSALRQLPDFLRAGEPLLITVPLDEPWLIALALAAVEVGAPVAVGLLSDAPTLRPGLIVTDAAAISELPDLSGSDASVFASLARRLGRNRTSPPARCLLVADHLVPVAVCETLQTSGTTVLHLATDPHACAPVLLNLPHCFRFDAYGLPLPDHTCELIDGCVVVRGPSVLKTTPEGAVTPIAARLDPDGFYRAPTL